MLLFCRLSILLCGLFVIIARYEIDAKVYYHKTKTSLEHAHLFPESSEFDAS